jgi:hypothetical protein
MLGRSVAERAVLTAARIASVSWPSISCTCQPEARKRSTSLSDIARLVAPSGPVLLQERPHLSERGFDLTCTDTAALIQPCLETDACCVVRLRFRCPASEIAA